jgi:hypothetical protein
MVVSRRSSRVKASLGHYRIYSRRTKTEPFAGHAGRVVERALDPRAAMEWAAQRLPTPIYSAFDFDAGEWSAPLPETTPDSAATRFDAGVFPEPPKSEWFPVDLEHLGAGMARHLATMLECEPEDLVQVPKPSLVPFAAQWALDHLASDSSGVVLVREMNDPSSKRIAWDSSVGILYPLTEAEMDLEELADLMDDAGSARDELVILTSTSRFDARSPLRLSDADLEELLSASSELILGAYDHESYVRWRRKSPYPSSKHPGSVTSR